MTTALKNIAAACLLGAWIGQASAHGIWIVVNTPYANHNANHVVAVLGFGHSFPVDDLLAQPVAVLNLAFYDIVDPDGHRQSLGLPDLNYQAPQTTAGGVLFERGDLGARKLAPGEKAREGIYSLIAESKATFVTRYKDRSGRMQLATVGMDELQDATEILNSVRFQTSAKAYYYLKTPSKPAPAGLELEIMPLSDISNVRVGDLVEFQLLLKGRAVTTDSDFERLIQASSNSFSLWDGVTLRSPIYGHKAKFRFPTPGQWHLFADNREVVEENVRLKEFKGKVKTIYHSTSLTLDVRP